MPAIVIIRIVNLSPRFTTDDKNRPVDLFNIGALAFQNWGCEMQKCNSRSAMVHGFFFNTLTSNSHAKPQRSG